MIKLFLKILLILILTGCFKIQPTSNYENPNQVPAQEMFGVKFDFSQNGQLRSRMWANKVIQMHEVDPMILSGGVQTVFYDSTGVRTGFLWSNSAEVDEARNYYVAKGDVFVWSDSSEASLVTQSLKWDPQSRKIHTQDSVRITTNYDTLYGIGLVADEGLKFWEITKPFGKSYREIKEKKRTTDRRK